MKKAVFAFFCWPVLLWAQPDAAQELDSISLKKKGNHHPQVVRADGKFPLQMGLQNLPDIMAMLIPINVKSYGYGMSSTPSLRGLGAENTTLWWNGVPINNPALGLADFSLAGLTGFSAELSSGSLNGPGVSGGFGGNILLQDEKPSIAKRKAGIEFGSTRRISGFLNYQHLQKNSTAQVFVQGHFDQAKFSFQDPYNQTNILQNQQSPIKQWQIRGSWTWNLKNHSKISLRHWSLWSDRDLQKAAGSTLVQHQKDQSQRTMIHWVGQKRKWTHDAIGAWLRDQLHYQNPGIQSQSIFQTIYSSWSALRQLSKGKFLIQAESRVFNMNGTPYRSQKTENWTTAWLRWGQHIHKNLQFHLFQSLTLVNFQKWVPVTGFSVDFSRTIKQSKWLWQLKGQNGTRLPTLNEKYFFPGGNPQILPEKGWFGETSITTSIPYYHSVFESQFLVYYQQINQKIQWRPDALGIFQPINLQSLSGYGFETYQQMRFDAGTWKGFLRFHFAYTMAHLQSETEPSTFPVYSPYNQSGGFFNMANKNWNIWVGYAYCGFRYVTTDGSDWIPAFTQWNAGGGWHPSKFPSHQLQIRITNITNTQIQWVKNYPQPENIVSLLYQFQF